MPLLVGIALDFFRPFSMTAGQLASLLFAVGVALLLAGALCVYLARRELASHTQPADPGKPTTEIVTTGIYSYSRNPLYLGVVLIVLGIGFVLNSWWVLISLVAAIILCHIILVFPEERYLAEKLGEDYQRYSRSVNRWLGRKRAIR